jgi:diguanylate cyclase (GGDEF)-like protein/PAS domain S-box-containing protein
MDAPARDHEDLLGLLAAGVEDCAIMLLDTEGHVRTWNERAPRLQGSRAEEIVGRHVSVFYPAQDIEAGKPERELAAAAVEGHLENEGWRVLKDGTQVWANVVITALREPDGTLRGFGTIMRDLTERRAHERAILEREQLVTGVLAASTEYAITGTDLDGTITILNTGAERVLGYRAEEMVGLRTPAVFHAREEMAARAQELGVAPGLEVFVSAARRLEPETREWTYLRKDGSRLTVLLTLTALLDGHGKPRGFIGIAADVSGRRHAEDALRVADERFRHAFDDAPIGLAIIAATPDSLGRYLDVNKAMCELTGYDRERLLVMTYQSLTHPGDTDRDVVRAQRLVDGTIERHVGEKRYIHASGRVIEASVGASLIRDEDGQPLHIIAHIEDVSDRKRYETQLQYMANHDPLTGLFNRARLDEALDAHVTRVRRYGAVGALLLIDLDQFKSVNDRLGHSVGDGLLISVARIMQSRARDTDVLTRLGGDEFALLMTEGGEAEAQILAGDLSDLIRRRSLVLEGGITASIGIAVFDERDSLRADDILAEADSAMYTAKHGGRDRIAAYVTEDGVRHQGAARLTLHHEIDAALKDDRFELRLQPVMDLRTSKIGKYEALLRMIGEDGTVIPPATFSTWPSALTRSTPSTVG